MILIAKLNANLLHSIDTTVNSDRQKLPAMVHLGWGGTFDHAEAACFVEIDYGSNIQIAVCHVN